jgi:Zn-dependent protease
MHEFSHAFVAYKCGDPTPKFAGRMTLNPIKHFDLFGLLAFALAGFGWAKPVPVNPYNFRRYKLGSFLTAAAGVTVNLLFAFLFYPIMVLGFQYLLPLTAGTYAEIFLFELISCLYFYSLSFCAFNLLPVYPLDGFRIVDTFSKRRSKVYWFLRNYSHYILLGLILVNYLSSFVPLLGYLNVLGRVMNFVVTYLDKPISLFWGLFF